MTREIVHWCAGVLWGAATLAYIVALAHDATSLMLMPQARRRARCELAIISFATALLFALTSCAPPAHAATPYLSYTGPKYAQKDTCGSQDSTHTLPWAFQYDSLRVHAEFRRQAPTWPRLADSLAAGSKTAWTALWPKVRLEADSMWIREKPFTPDKFDTLRAPIDGPGLNAWFWTVRRYPGNYSCAQHRAWVRP